MPQKKTAARPNAAARSFAAWRSARRRKPSAALVRRRARELAAAAGASGDLTGWVGEKPELPPSARMPDYVRILVEELLKAAMCANGWRILEEIDDLLTKHGKTLPKKAREELEASGARLWENLVRAGC